MPHLFLDLLKILKLLPYFIYLNKSTEKLIAKYVCIKRKLTRY